MALEKMMCGVQQAIIVFECEKLSLITDDRLRQHSVQQNQLHPRHLCLT